MAKVVLAMFVSLDGYIEGPDGQFIPPAWSDAVGEHWSGKGLAAARHLIYGRTNFEFNKGFWTSSDAVGMPETEAMNALPKTVVSSRLSGDPGWNGQVVRGEDLADAVAALRQTVAGDIYSFGGAGLANSLMALDVVDEYRLMVLPQVFGDGKRLFAPGLPPLALKLIETTPLDTGAVILHYVRDRA